MKNLKVLLVAAIALVAFNSQAQIRGDEGNKFSIDVNYPFLVGDNGASEFNNGAIDFGAKWNFIHITKLDLGIAVDYGMINGKDGNDSNSSYVKPKINAELKIWKINPYANLGYTYLTTKIDGFEDQKSDGVNLTLGLKWHIFIPKLYLNAAFDYTSLGGKDEINEDFESNFNIFKVGVGFQL